MLHLAIEEPTVNNESLLARDTDSDSLSIDHAEGLRLNRYTLVSADGLPETAIGLAIQNMLCQISVRVFIVLSWLDQLPGRSSVAAKVIQKRYEKRGWRIHCRDGHHIALKEASVNEIDSWPPFGIDPADSGYILMMGDQEEEDILSALDDYSSEFLARNKYFVPTRGLLESLEQRDLTLLYGVAHDLGWPGVIEVGPRRIDSTELARHVEIGEIFEGESAYRVLV